MLHAVITLHDMVNCTIDGLEPEHTAQLIKLWSFSVPGAVFSAMYKMGKWDGKYKFFKQQGHTRIIILPQILKWLMPLGYTFTTIDHRVRQEKLTCVVDECMFSDFDRILRWYQVEAVQAMVDNGRGVVEAATGAGKTLMAAAICKIYEPLRVMVVVPNDTIIRQTAAEFTNRGLDFGYYTGKKKSYDNQHIIGSLGALHNNTKIYNEVDVFIVDECHGAKAQKQLTEQLLTGPGAKVQYRFGLTGTIPREKLNKLSLFSTVGNVIYRIPAHVLIAEGVLAEPEVNVIQLNEDEHASLRNTKWANEKEYLQTDIPRLKIIANIINERIGDQNTLILVNFKKVGKLLAELIPGAVFLSGDDSTSVRDAHYNEYSPTTKKRLITTIQITEKGVDMPDLVNLCYVDIGQSFTRVIQSIGRNLRRTPTKSVGYVYDICSSLRHSAKHTNYRMAYYKNAKYPYTFHSINISEDEIC